MRRHVRIGFIALAAALAAACGKKADQDAPIAFVPADTPYVIAALEPVPDATAKQFAAQAQSVWSVILPMFDQLVADTEHLKDDDEATPEQLAERAKVRRVMKAVIDEIRNRDTPEKWREVGLGTQVRSAIYGVGLLPVLRAEILDPDALRAMIARIEQNAGEKLATARIGEQDVWTIGGEPMLGLIAIEGKHLVVTAVPAGADEALKRRVLGLDRPAQSLAADTLADFNKARGYLPYGSGWIDTRRLLAALNDDPAVAAIAKAIDEPKPELDAACRGEFDAIAAKAPRLAVGYTRFDAERMTMHMRLDLDPTLAKALAALPGPLPGTNSADALFEMAFALPVLRGRDFLVAQADAIAAAPFKCEVLQPLNEEFAEMKTKIEQMIPPPLADLVGVRITLDSLVLPDANNGEKFDVSGRVLVGSNNPTFLTGLAQMSVPALQKIALTPDGKAVAIPADVIPGGYAQGYEIHAAMGAKTLGLAVGKDQAAKLETAVTASATSSGAVIESSLSGSVYKLLGEAFTLFGDKLPDKDRAGIDMQRKLYAMYAKWFKRVGGGVSFGPEGVDITQDVEYAKQ